MRMTWWQRILMRIFAGHSAAPGSLRHRAAGWMFRNVPGLIDCGTFESFLMDYYEGTLPVARRTRFETHLAMCGLCRESYRGYVKSIEVGQALFADRMPDAPLPDDVPAGLVDAVLKSMHEGPRRKD